MTGSHQQNTAHGGGVYHGGNSLIIRHSTVTANTCAASKPAGAGVYGDSVMDNSIVSGNSGHSDYEGTPTGQANLIGGDAMLGPLQDNGGPTLTIALLPGSPAIDAGDNADAPEFDQRGQGFPRIVNGTIDIGAFEVQSAGVPNPQSFVYEAFRGAVFGPPLAAGLPMAIAAATPCTEFLDVRLEPTSADGSSPTARSLVNEADESDTLLSTRRQRRAYYLAESPVKGAPADDIAHGGTFGFVKAEV